jgi:uncharacterized surface protein with fasciclin (FAS1) repeats
MVTYSWAEIGSGDIATQLGKMTGPNVKDFDFETEITTEWNDNFDKFIAAAQSQGTMDLLKGSGPFTLLVPVDSSIKQNVDTKAHILKGKFSFDDLMAGGSAETLAGTTVEYSKAGRGKVRVEDANVKAAWKPVDNGEGIKNTAFPFDVECTNGVIHAIDEPLVETSGSPLPASAASGGSPPKDFAKAPVPASFDDSLMSRGAAAGGGGGAPSSGLDDLLSGNF